MDGDQISTPGSQTGSYGSGGQIKPDFIPKDRYTSDDVLRLEFQKLWPRVWQIVCRVEELAEVGDYVRYDIGNDPLIVVRSSVSEIKAFYNICQHRGRRLVDKPSGNIRNFYCRYHGWKWGLDGALDHVPHREEWAACGEFNDKALALPEPQCAQWGGWVWINMDTCAESLESYLGDVAKILDPFDFGDLRRAWHVAIEAPVNWKVVIEAFNEGYHSGATHSSYLDYHEMRAPAALHGRHAMYFTGFGDNNPRARRENGGWKRTETPAELLYYQSVELYGRLKAMILEPMMRAVERVYTELKNAPADQVFRRLWDYHKEELEATGAKWPQRLTFEHMASAGTSWHIFPNTIVLPSPDGVLWYRMRPHASDPDRCVFDIWCLQRFAPGKEPTVEPQVFDGFEAARGVNPFLEEDFDNMAAVNAGMKSRGWRGARTNPGEEMTIVNFHRELDKYLNE